MPRIQESQDQQALEQMRYTLKDQQDLIVRLGAELTNVLDKEDAGRRILEEIAALTKDHPEDLAIGIGDQQRANAKLLKLTKERSMLELRIANAKQRAETIQGQIAKFDQPKLARLEKIRSLFQRLAG